MLSQDAHWEHSVELLSNKHCPVKQSFIGSRIQGLNSWSTFPLHSYWCILCPLFRHFNYIYAITAEFITTFITNLYSNISYINLNLLKANSSVYKYMHLFPGGTRQAKMQTNENRQMINKTLCWARMHTESTAWTSWVTIGKTAHLWISWCLFFD